MYNECRHIFISGKKCGSPALKDQNFCFYHTTARKRQKSASDNQPYDRVNPKTTALALATLDESDAIQLSISEVVLALAANRIDPRRARILLYGLQIASQHYRHQQPGAPFKRVPQVSQRPGILQNDLIREVFIEEDGVEVGPEKQSPDPEDVPEREQGMTLGKFLLLEAIKDGHITPEEVREKEREWKEMRISLKAVAEEPSVPPVRQCRSTTPRNSHALTTLQK